MSTLLCKGGVTHFFFRHPLTVTKFKSTWKDFPSNKTQLFASRVHTRGQLRGLARSRLALLASIYALLFSRFSAFAAFGLRVLHRHTSERRPTAPLAGHWRAAGLAPAAALRRRRARPCSCTENVLAVAA